MKSLIITLSLIFSVSSVANDAINQLFSESKAAYEYAQEAYGVGLVSLTELNNAKLTFKKAEFCVSAIAIRQQNIDIIENNLGIGTSTPEDLEKEYKKKNTLISACHLEM